VAYLVRIMCINKRNRFSPHERIATIGGMNPDGTLWKLTEEQAIEGIEQGRWIFYVERPQGDRVTVLVAQGALGRKYLKTQADGLEPNNLLWLPECL
jgi:Protein of unknown function (DUF3892)